MRLLVLLASLAFTTLTAAVGPAAFWLAGDSTTAPINAAKTGGGWGDGFIATLQNGAVGYNYGHNGATTISYRSGGYWAQILAGVAGNATTHTCYVTIQVRISPLKKHCTELTIRSLDTMTWRKV